MAVVLACAFWLPSCTSDDARHEPQASPDQHVVWDYQADHPWHWGELDETFSLCATGTMQSPIDLPKTAVHGPEGLALTYYADDLRIVDNGHTIQVNHGKPSTLEIDGRSFRLIQYHFHSPSEHTIEGLRYPLELHLVHLDDRGNYGVIGVFFSLSDRENPAHEAVWRHLPGASDGVEHTYAGEPVDPNSFLPSDRTHYRYQGSLTTPPCTENVTWLVMQQPLYVTQDHLAAFQAHYRANVRPLQPRPDWCLDAASHAKHEQQNRLGDDKE